MQISTIKTEAEHFVKTNACVILKTVGLRYMWMQLKDTNVSHSMPTYK